MALPLDSHEDDDVILFDRDLVAEQEEEERRSSMDSDKDDTSPSPTASSSESSPSSSPVTSPTASSNQIQPDFVIHPIPTRSYSNPASTSRVTFAPNTRLGSPTSMLSKNRMRSLGLTPVAQNSTNSHSLPLGTGTLPKAQPLSRALFAKMANETPHAGMGTRKKSWGSQQVWIVPSKKMKTRFELPLTAAEFARR